MTTIDAPGRLGLRLTHMICDEFGSITGWLVDGRHVVDEPSRAPETRLEVVTPLSVTLRIGSHNA